MHQPTPPALPGSRAAALVLGSIRHPGTYIVLTMIRAAHVIALLGAATVPLACGGAAPQTPTPQPPAPVASSTAPGTGVIAAPATDLSVASEPADVVAVVRWKSPAVTFNTIQQWFGIPVPVDEIADEIFRARRAASAFALDAPVDLVVALDPKAPDQDPTPFIGFSVGMRSLDEGRRALEQRAPLQEVGPGMYRVELGTRQDRLLCVLGPSLGAAPARLVCGPRDRDVDALQPYLARGLAAAPAPASDLHGELRFAPVQRRYGPMLPSVLQLGSSFISHKLGTGDRSLDRAVTDAVSGLSDEILALANDLDGIQLDLRLDQAARVVSGDMSVRLKSRNSWIAQRLFDNKDKAGAPPELFWALPAASEAAFYNWGQKNHPYDGIRRVGGELIRAALANQGLPAADREAIAQLFEQLFQTWPVTVSANGHLDTLPPRSSTVGDMERLRDTFKAGIGWHLIGVDEKPDHFDRWLRDVAAAYNRPGVRRWIASKAQLDAKKLPKVKYAATTVPGLTGVKSLEISLSVDPPAYSLDGFPQDRHGKPVTFTYWVLLMPDGGRSWIAMGADRPTLEKRLIEAKSGQRTLTSRAGLETLRSDRTVSGGFMTVAGIAWGMTRDLMSALGGHRSGRLDPVEIADALNRMPHHGKDPITLASSVRDGTPSEFTVRFRLSKGTIDDLSALTSRLGGGGPTMAVPPPWPPPRP